MARWTLLALLALASGCVNWSKDDDDDDDDDNEDDTSSDEDDTGEDTEDTVDSTVAPVIESIDRVDCAKQQSAGEIWTMDLTVTDPQGNDTVSIGELVVENEEGGVLADYPITCNDGTCIGSFRADYDGVGCSLSGTIDFVFTVTDENENVSEKKTYHTE